MDKRFPGMDPFLEQPELWPQVHNRLIVAIADALTPQIVPQYRVSIEERIYTSSVPPIGIGVADVALRSSDPGSSRVGTALTSLTAPIKVHVPIPVEIKERFLQVRATQTGEVLCVIEILSPANKREGQGRSVYVAKRHPILGSLTSLVEIDLLKRGQPMPLIEASRGRYRILVSRGSLRPEADLYAFELKDPIPAFPVPLRQGEAEPSIDLQRLLDEVYARARFDLAIDYSQISLLSLSDAERDWVIERLGMEPKTPEERSNSSTFM